jgi:hypothetical protein
LRQLRKTAFKSPDRGAIRKSSLPISLRAGILARLRDLRLFHAHESGAPSNRTVEIDRHVAPPVLTQSVERNVLGRDRAGLVSRGESAPALLRRGVGETVADLAAGTLCDIMAVFSGPSRDLERLLRMPFL